MSTNKISSSITDIIPIIDYQNDCFILKNGTLMDMLQITCKDLVNASEDEREYDILCYSKFYKTFGDDVKIIALNFPTNTKAQQEYIQHKIANTTNPVFIRHLENKLRELVYIEEHRTNREYYLIIFSSSIEEYRENINVLKRSLGNEDLIEEMSKEKKIQIISKICNQNTPISF